MDVKVPRRPSCHQHAVSIALLTIPRLATLDWHIVRASCQTGERLTFQRVRLGTCSVCASPILCYVRHPFSSPSRRKHTGASISHALGKGSAGLGVPASRRGFEGALVLLLVGHVRLQGRAERTPPEWCMSSRLQLSRIKWSRDALGALSSLCIRPEGCRHWTLALTRHTQPEGEYPMIAQQFGEEERDACKPYSQPAWARLDRQ